MFNLSNNKMFFIINMLRIQNILPYIRPAGYSAISVSGSTLPFTVNSEILLKKLEDLTKKQRMLTIFRFLVSTSVFLRLKQHLVTF